ETAQRPKRNAVAIRVARAVVVDQGAGPADPRVMFGGGPDRAEIAPPRRIREAPAAVGTLEHAPTNRRALVRPHLQRRVVSAAVNAAEIDRARRGLFAAGRAD